jgi:ketosteroid isomerase-like protein
VSLQNVELHRHGVEAGNSRDVEALIAIADPSIELHSSMTTPGGAVYHGHDGVRKYIRDLQEAFGDDLRVEPKAYFDLGEHTLMSYAAYGRGQQSGVEVAGRATQVAKWRDGLCVYLKVYLQVEDALKDLGVSQDALEPIAP